MPTEFYYPISGAQASIPSGHDDFGLIGAANKNLALRPGGGRSGPLTHDDDATTTEGALNGLKEQAANADWPGPIAAISALTFGGRTKCSHAAQPRNFNFINAAGTKGATVTSDSGSSGYSEAIADAMSARPGGGAWSAADLADSTTIFLEWHNTTGNGSQYGWCTSLFGQISYFPPGSGFVFLLGLAGLGALPFIGAMDFGQFLRYLSWRRLHHPRHTILTGNEVRQAWRELREYRYPRFFLPAV